MPLLRPLIGKLVHHSRNSTCEALLRLAGRLVALRFGHDAGEALQHGRELCLKLFLTEDLLGVVYEVRDCRPVLAGIGAVQARDGLHGGDLGELLVHVDGLRKMGLP